MRFLRQIKCETPSGFLTLGVAAALAVACSVGPDGDKPGGPMGPNGQAGSTGIGGGPVVDMPPVGYDPATLDPGHVPVHRLTNTEYNNSVADLLGTTLKPADFFQAQT